MPHPRQRFLMKQLKKRLAYSPVVALQGVRQCGKSFLVRELAIKQIPKLKYETLDNPDSLDGAERNSLNFLQQTDSGFTLAIEEAQRVPKLFTSIKFLVDKERHPG